MVAADPTYPAYPVACAVAAALMLLVLSSSLVRQTWNLGVVFLCIWLLLQNIVNTINTIVWSDNADVKLYVWCDIVTRLDVAMTVGSNIAPLIIARRLYMIAHLRSTNSSGGRMPTWWNQAVEWVLGLVWPLVSAGPLYYIFQGARFEVVEGAGCVFAPAMSSILAFVLLAIWLLLPATLSIAIYYPKIAWIFYRHNKEMNQFLRINNSDMTRMNYIRVLAMASLDISLTLPIAIVSLVLTSSSRPDYLGSLPWYSGWEATHSHWEPIGIPFSFVVSGGKYNKFIYYWYLWPAPIVSFVTFGIFGLTREARASYRRAFNVITRRCGWNSSLRTERTSSRLSVIEFNARPVESSLDTDVRSHLSTESWDVHGLRTKKAAHSELGSAREPCEDKKGIDSTAPPLASAVSAV
ncbi:unnamed protein product [Peniophora sp. CBMAI 1063]|nr:unnamed protein product [Peniophora sp. CBMAI 1063]